MSAADALKDICKIFPQPEQWTCRTTKLSAPDDTDTYATEWCTARGDGAHIKHAEPELDKAFIDLLTENQSTLAALHNGDTAQAWTHHRAALQLAATQSDCVRHSATPDFQRLPVFVYPVRFCALLGALVAYAETPTTTTLRGALAALKALERSTWFDGTGAVLCESRAKELAATPLALAILHSHVVPTDHDECLEWLRVYYWKHNLAPILLPTAAKVLDTLSNPDNKAGDAEACLRAHKTYKEASRALIAARPNVINEQIVQTVGYTSFDAIEPFFNVES